MPCYLLSKMGCEMVANKLTGEKGILFTAAYVKRFNEMEAAEREAVIKAHARPRLSEFNNAVKNVLSGMARAKSEPGDIMKFLCGVYKPLGIKVSEYGCEPLLFTATQIARLAGVYSETGRPHGHAVSAIISKLNVQENQIVVVPYGLVGVTFRYNIGVAKAVIDWLIERHCPNIVPHLCFNYHIYYHRQKTLFDDDVISLDDDDDDEFGFTTEELDELCGEYDDCEDCPGFYDCCETD